MTHHHHHHGHTHDDAVEMSFEEKMTKLLAHWIKHNEDHGQSYTDWALKARAHDLEPVAKLLDEVGLMTREITGKFEQALTNLGQR